MNEGIIQGVFKSHTDRLKIYEGMLVYTPADCSLLIKMLEQELIEKIKQESDVYQSEISDYKDAISLDKLIGDNQ